jgi:hypothetical protein
MAKPDLDEGYLRVAHELFAAIAVAGFTKWEMVVLREVFDQIYGPRKTSTARLSSTDIAARAGTQKQVIYRAIRMLVEAGVLAKTAGGEYRFIKDYEAWRHGDDPRFSPSESTYCRSARRVKTASAPAPTAVSASDDGGKRGRLRAGTDALTPVSAGATRDVVPPGPPIEERVRSGEEERSEEEGGVVRRAAADDCPPVPPDDGPLMIMPGGHPMARGDVEDIWRRLWLGWGDKRICAGFFEHQQWFPADIWRQAISEVASGNTTPRTIAYFEQRCGDIKANGPRQAPTVFPARATPSKPMTEAQIERERRRQWAREA